MMSGMGIFFLMVERYRNTGPYTVCPSLSQQKTTGESEILVVMVRGHDWLLQGSDSDGGKAFFPLP